MKFVNEKKVYSMFEVTKASSFSRNFLLELEENNLIEPYFKDKNTSYRYYDETIFIKLNEIKTLFNAGLSKNEIKEYYINNDLDDESLLKKENKEKIIQSLKNKKDDIDTSLLFLSSLVNKTYKKKMNEIVYYYEERNINNVNLISPLLKEIYIHALAKNYCFSSFPPFVLFPKTLLNDENNDIFLNGTNYIKVKICIPLIRKYDEKNIESLPKNISLIYEINKTSFLNAFKNFQNIVKNNHSNDFLYLFFLNNEKLKIHKFILPINI